jgi:hypothetical protein
MDPSSEKNVSKRDATMSNEINSPKRAKHPLPTSLTFNQTLKAIRELDLTPKTVWTRQSEARLYQGLSHGPFLFDEREPSPSYDPKTSPSTHTTKDDTSVALNTEMTEDDEQHSVDEEHDIAMSDNEAEIQQMHHAKEYLDLGSGLFCHKYRYFGDEWVKTHIVRTSTCEILRPAN